MRAEELRLGFAMCGSYCTYAKVLPQLRRAAERFGSVLPILSENSATTDSRFGAAEDFLRQIEEICGCPPITSIREAEPIGPKKLLDVLVIAPCTGNTLAKLAAGITDTCVTMAAKAHMRNGRPVVIAPSTNDGLSVSLRNIGDLMSRKHIYFVPFGQDDIQGKPTSLVAHMEMICPAAEAATVGQQLQPVLLEAQRIL